MVIDNSLICPSTVVVPIVVCPLVSVDTWLVWGCIQNTRIEKMGMWFHGRKRQEEELSRVDFEHVLVQLYIWGKVSRISLLIS